MSRSVRLESLTYFFFVPKLVRRYIILAEEHVAQGALLGFAAASDA
jgi:hypothetical protein